MATPGHAAPDPDLGERFSSNNPYRQQAASHSAEDQHHFPTGLQRSFDSEKEVMVDNGRTSPSDAPIPVERELCSQSRPEPTREADKEVIESWQLKSREESAPIPMAYHESQSPHGKLLDDHEEPPPAYEAVNEQSRSGSDDNMTTPSSIEPDGSGSTPPKPEDRTAVGRLLTWIPASPRLTTNQMSPLLQPVVIPQLDVPPQGESVPFSRCYSDALASHDVSIREFASFLDGLAVAQAPNSALQGLKMFAVGVHSLPLPIVPLAGRGISALATSGSGHSGSRAKLYIERAKNEYFAPRGLRLSIIKDHDLNPRLLIPAHVNRLAPLTSNTLTASLCDRRLEGLAPYVAPLRFDLPEQDKEVQGVHKLARKHLDHLLKDQRKKIARLREEQWRDISTMGGDIRAWDRNYTAKMIEMRTLQLDSIPEYGSEDPDEEASGATREWVEELQRRQRDLQIVVAERQTLMQHVDRGGQGVRAEMDEINWSRKLKWIVIENLQ